MSGFNGILMGMGNPLLDISSEVGQDVLDKYDVKLDSAILAEDKHQPIYKELVDKYNPQFIAGGATQNSIRVAQWMLKEAGKENATAFMGCVGKDEFGTKLETCASADGVLAHYMKDESTPTGTCAVLVKDGERSLIANLAAANNFKISHLETATAKSIYESAQFYYIAGFFLTVSVESLLSVAEHALANDKTFCLNLSAPFIVDFFGDAVAAALPYADFLFCNESEAEAYAKKHNLGEDLKEVALKVAASPKKNDKRPRTVIFTQGSGSTIVACNGSVKEYSVVALPKEQLVDTNGAGDAFVGGFLSQLVQDKPVEECVDAGHWAAKYIIQQSGTTISKVCDYKK
uniref:Adenosine kinase n=1 Tax=Eucampia antarctica TaxID=49252 RepID=A0A7S2W9R3_9STRA|mmetsp:Transcript_24307/g.23353  ORF Transcript_24307/g.23353 Transcript_24307/m.23353 type:complete len:346 (+) Transcript_24307:45-1082(+)|eukprot:CAMPEP_0197830668 /NCGR_PEP_ID=MMETSP1437-20131217/7275_1 /TAXON_ID=49252 ORGANISM="Eucampia antarctica, Strain CCMP1452" /NCGR_SAMPLE_ID=MMETSP1437 /ASSEMBLY_ACC=CAM_ASM_001096 /LENGTH=345 /DNA_ID=CAMNT_0043433211 /DNA_START=51 /DNA_END=1088 /DNA_ORIENTATION=+